MKILNFGSLNLDYVYNVDTIVRPGETVSSHRMEQFCGGKGLNQSIALARAGARVYHAGCIGTDGDILKQTLLDNGVHTDFVKTTKTPSGNAIIQLDQKGQNCIILFGGANRQITREMIDEVLTHFEQGDLLLLQNEINHIDYIMDKAYEKGLIIALNPSPLNEAVLNAPLSKVSYFILNEIEGNALSGKTASEDILEEMRRLYPNAKIVLTLGKDGAMYFDGSAVYRNGIYKIAVADTTGAGDTFLGYFLALVSHESPSETLRLASVASSLAVSVKGASNSIPKLETVRTADLEPLI